MRLVQLAIAFVAGTALFAGSTFLGGGPFVAFSIAVIVAAAAVTYVAYVLRARRWVMQTYQLLVSCRLAEVRERIEAERAAASSPIKPRLLDLLWAEALFWSGDHAQAYAAAHALDAGALPELWRGSVYEIKLATAAFTGRAAEARAVLTEHAAVLRERPGFHQLDALVSLREGDTAKARAAWQSASNAGPRPQLVEAALALFQAELAVAHGEPAEKFAAEAERLGGDSFCGRSARALVTS
ncbi:MAG: hypothetical protein JNK82_22510 [Myxococcaceae bacterium]|nr:hypothetical protein [Myxococcaceae bacterium]